MTKPITDDELLAIRACHAESTPGDWKVKTCNNGTACWCRIVVTDSAPNGCVASDGSIIAVDAEFIARAHKDVPRMLAEIDRLRAEIDRIGALCRHILRKPE